MKHELKITEDNYREVVLKRAIIICWVLLAICFVIKIFGGNFFDIICNNESFIKFCDWFDVSIIRYVIYYIYFTVESTILICIIDNKFKIKSKKYILYLITCSIFWVIKILVEQNIININLEIFSVISLIILYIILLIFSKKPLHSLWVIMYQLFLGLISSIIKNIGFDDELSNSFLLYFIFNIDYYIVLVMTLLYIKLKFKKEV